MQDKIYALPSLQPTGCRQVTQDSLPASLTPLIGREQEIQACLDLLQHSEARLVTLIGPGGVGKTRLGLQVCQELLHEFTDGIYFVSLAPISNPTLVIPTIARIFDIWEADSQSLKDRLKVCLRNKHLLLLLDNFEQVIVAASDLADLLIACPGLSLLITSRAVLHISGEHEFPVPPLSMPDPKKLPEIELLSQYAAIALFLQRVKAIIPNFHLTKANARAIVEICSCLDGLPLAIELAAARIKLLPPLALQARLDRRLVVLTSGTQDAPARQQTLRNTIMWSYDLLNGQEQQLFRQLSVFVGGCSLEAIEVISGAQNSRDEEASILDRVASLLDKSLIQQKEQEGQEPRLIMLETIHELGQELLIMNTEMASVRQAHAEYYLLLVGEAKQGLSGQEKEQWLMKLQQDQDNIRAALHWLMEQEEIEKALRLIRSLVDFWWIRGHLNEGRTFLEWGLRVSERASTPVRAEILYVAGWLSCLQGDIGRAEALCEESLVIFRELEDTRSMVSPLWMLGYITLIGSNYTKARVRAEEALKLARELDDKENSIYTLEILAMIAFYQGEYSKACSLFEGSLELCKALDNTWSFIRSLCFLALVVLSQGDIEKAHVLLEECLILARKVAYKECIAQSLNLSGQAALQQGNITRARALMEESLELFKESGNQSGAAQALSGLGWVAFLQGDALKGQALLSQSLEIARKTNDRWFLALCLEGLGTMVASQGQATYAVQLLSVGETLCATINAVLPPVMRNMRESTIALARTQLGEDVFATTWAAGCTMTPQQVLTHTESTSIEPVPSPVPQTISTTSQLFTSPKMSATSSLAELTTREVEILHLVAQGLTNAQVADKLVISPRTVNWHLTTIYNKLGVSSRSAATRYAFEQHLV